MLPDYSAFPRHSRTCQHHHHTLSFLIIPGWLYVHNNSLRLNDTTTTGLTFLDCALPVLGQSRQQLLAFCNGCRTPDPLSKMPGVPTGRACEGCRKQKKKVLRWLLLLPRPVFTELTKSQCDEKKPACSRCLRLNIPCVGSGERRFKFKEERRFNKSPETDDDRQIATKQEAREFTATAAAVSAAEKAARTIFLPPSNELTFLTSVFVQTLKPSTDLRYNLVWNYGGFLAEVPQRLGANEALDASVYAVCAAHSSFCLYKDISVEALTKYSHALRMLRVCLDDPVKASTPETLCAVLMLLICQVSNRRSHETSSLLTTYCRSGLHWNRRELLYRTLRRSCENPQSPTIYCPSK